MKRDWKQCGGFTTLGVLLSLTVLSVAVSFCVKWYVSQNYRRSVLRQKQRLVPCTEAFSLFVKEQPSIKSCVGTWYAVRNASEAGRFDFVRQAPCKYDFKITVENNAWTTEKTAYSCIIPQGVTEGYTTEPPKKKPEFLIVRFYAYEKTHCLHTCFVPVTAKRYKAEELTVEPVERFMLTPKAEKSAKTEEQ